MSDNWEKQKCSAKCFLEVTFFYVSGGVMGLFLGMSILSIFEVVFWLVNTICSYLQVKKPSSSKKRRLSV